VAPLVRLRLLLGRSSPPLPFTGPARRGSAQQEEMKLRVPGRREKQFPFFLHPKDSPFFLLLHAASTRPAHLSFSNNKFCVFLFFSLFGWTSTLTFSFFPFFPSHTVLLGCWKTVAQLFESAHATGKSPNGRQARAAPALPFSFYYRPFPFFFSFFFRHKRAAHECGSAAFKTARPMAKAARLGAGFGGSGPVLISVPPPSLFFLSFFLSPSFPPPNGPRLRIRK